MMDKPSRSELGTLAAILVIMVAAQSINLNAPLLRLHESSLTQFGKQARNQLRWGPGITKFGLLNTTGPRLDYYEDYRKHFYHSPALPGQILALGFGMLGESERTMRMVGMGCAVWAVLMFFWLLTALGLRGCHRLAPVAVFALNPMFAYFSIVALQMVLALAFGLTALSAYWTWRSTQRKRWLVLMFAAFFLGAHCVWAIFYFMVAVALHLLVEKPRRAPLAFLVLALGPIFFATYLLHLYVQDPSALKYLWRSFQERSQVGIPLSIWASNEVREFGVYHGILIPLAVIGLIRAVRRRDALDKFVLCLSVLLVDELWLREYATKHFWSSFPGVPFLVIAAAVGVTGIVEKIRSQRAAGAVVTGILLICFAQSGAVLWDRLTRFGAYEFYYKMAVAARSVSEPHEKIGVVTDDISHYSRYYLDRFTISYIERERRLEIESFADVAQNVSPAEALESFVRAGVRYVIAAKKSEILEQVGFMRTLTDEQLGAFGVDTGSSELVRALDERYESKLIQGFRVYDLRLGKSR